MRLLKREVCPICESDGIELFKKGSINPQTLTADDFKITDNSYGSLWTFYKCKSCKFVFSNPSIPENEVIKFYSLLEDSEYTDEAQGRAKNFHTILKRLEKIDKPNKTILDIGAASGIFLSIAKRFNYKIDGIEPSEYLVREAKKNFGIDIFNGVIEEYITDKKYSVITLLDILEHLVNPDKFIKEIEKHIEDRGILVIVTPDIDSLSAKIFGRKWWHYRTAHINFFNIKSLSRLLYENNYEIIKKKRYAWHFSFYYLATRLFPKLKKSEFFKKYFKKINIKLQLFDSWEVYARRKPQTEIDRMDRFLKLYKEKYIDNDPEDEMQEYYDNHDYF